jgi:hypothetical protein
VWRGDEMMKGGCLCRGWGVSRDGLVVMGRGREE